MYSTSYFEVYHKTTPNSSKIEIYEVNQLIVDNRRSGQSLLLHLIRSTLLLLIPPRRYNKTPCCSVLHSRQAHSPLRTRRAPGASQKYAGIHRGDLVGEAVSHEGALACARVCSDNNSSLETRRHESCRLRNNRSQEKQTHCSSPGPHNGPTREERHVRRRIRCQATGTLLAPWPFLGLRRNFFSEELHVYLEYLQTGVWDYSFLL